MTSPNPAEDIVGHARKLRHDLNAELPNGVGNTIDALCERIEALSTPTISQSNEDAMSEARKMWVLAAATLERDVLLHGMTEDEQDVMIGAILNAASRLEAQPSEAMKEANKKLQTLRRLCEASGQPFYVEILDEVIPVYARERDAMHSVRIPKEEK